MRISRPRPDDDWEEPRRGRGAGLRPEYYDDEMDDEPPRRRAPLILRLIAFAAMIGILFALGYGMMSLVFKWMDSKGDRSPSNIAENVSEAEKVIAQVKSDDEKVAGPETVVCRISIPEGDKFVTRQIQCPGGIREDTIKGAVSAYIDALKENSTLDIAAANLNLFQSGDTLYLNMNGKFLQSLNTLGADRSRYVITGLVRTISDNFSPITKIKFYIDGREVSDKKPVDLTSAWGI